MVKLINPAVPPQYAELRQKALLDFAATSGEIATRNTIIASRGNREQRRAATRLPTAAEVWGLLTAAEQDAWRVAALMANGGNRGYDLFVADALYRTQAGLPPQNTPHPLHQLFGLTIETTESNYLPCLFIEKNNVVGPFSFSVSAKLTASLTEPTMQALISIGGEWNDNGTIRWDRDRIWLPQVNTDWTRYTAQLLTTGRLYSRLTCTVQPRATNATMQVDNLLLTDDVGDVLREDFFVPSYGQWIGKPSATSGITMVNRLWPTAFVHEYFDD